MTPEIYETLRKIYRARLDSQPCGNCRMGDVERYLRQHCADKEEAKKLYEEFSKAEIGFVA